MLKKGDTKLISMIHVDIKLSQKIVKPILWLTNFFSDNIVVVVCKGYGDDWDYYTGLYWDEDKDLWRDILSQSYTR